jgi:hypothetical protein
MGLFSVLFILATLLLLLINYWPCRPAGSPSPAWTRFRSGFAPGRKKLGEPSWSAYWLDLQCRGSKIWETPKTPAMDREIVGFVGARERFAEG